jgi:hypothetical protein
MAWRRKLVNASQNALFMILRDRLPVEQGLTYGSSSLKNEPFSFYQSA